MTTKTDDTEVCSAKPIALSIGRRILAIALFLIMITASLLVTSNARANPQQMLLEWMDQFGSYYAVPDIAYAVDSGGNTYVAGETSGTLPGQTSAGSIDAFVRKVDSGGNEVWTNQFGTSYIDGALGVCADDSKVYVVGYSNKIFPGQTNYGPFIRKYDTDGNVLWMRQFGVSTLDKANSVCMDASGVYVAGGVNGPLPGGQGHAGSQDSFIRKYDHDGNVLWTRQFGTYQSDAATGIAVWGSSLYSVGYSFTPSYGSNDVWVKEWFCVNGYGGFQTQTYTNAEDVPCGMSADASGIYIAGYCLGALPGQTDAGRYDAWVKKYNYYGYLIWTRQFGTHLPDYAYGISSDASGVYVVGSTLGILPGQTGADGYDAFVRKYDAYGTEVWTKQFGTSGIDRARGVSVDVSGVYVSGVAGGTFPDLTSENYDDAFIRKFDCNGNVLWTNEFGVGLSSQYTSRDIGMSVDAEGYVFVVGSVRGAIPGEESEGGSDAFVRKYDNCGNVLWTSQFGGGTDVVGGTCWDQARGICVDASGVYVCGDFEGWLQSQDIQIGNAFLRKYDSNGNIIWTREFGSTGLYGKVGPDIAYGVSSDTSGVYVVGRTGAGTAFPGQTSAGSYDAFVRKYDTEGSVIWTSQFGTAGQDDALGISVDESGVYVSGWMYGRAFIQKYTSGGAVVWTSVCGPSECVSCAYGVSVDSSGIYIAGYALGGALPGQTSAGSYDAFVRKYDSSGGTVWTRQFGTSGDDQARGVFADSQGVCIAGFTEGALPGQTSAGSYDAFVRRYDAYGNVVSTTQFGSSNDDRANGISVGASGVYITGHIGGYGNDVFVAKFVENAPPAITSFTASPETVVEGSTTALEVTAVDPNGDMLTYLFDFEDDGVFDVAGYASTVAHVYPEDGVYPVRVRVSDGLLSTEATTSVCVLNAGPVVTITGPVSGFVVAVGTPVPLAGVFNDPGIQDTHMASWSFDTMTIAGTVTETGGSGSVQDTFSFSSAGIYAITLTVTDDDGGVGIADTVGDLIAYIVVYDPTAGFVTGGGWIDSPGGAYAPDSTLSGKATFGFVSKYQKGAKIPTGETEFQFRVANLNFHSAAYEWLVVSGARAQYKGTGTINGQGDCGFVLTVIDGALPGGGGVDRFRIKIWDRATDVIIYDSQMGNDDFADPTAVIGGGSIVIHKQ